MGAGKSTATCRFGERMATTGVPVAACTEAADPHPVRASDDLADFFQPWLHARPDELAARVREKWARYVEQRLRDNVFTVMDGQLFHGDLTNLFMMEMPSIALLEHMARLMSVLSPLRPVVVYFRPNDLRRALASVFAARGPKWETYQLDWKLRSPYAARRQLLGMEGFVALYEDYRVLCDALFAVLDCDKLAIATDAGDWPSYEARIVQALHGVHTPV